MKQKKLLCLASYVFILSNSLPVSPVAVSSVVAVLDSLVALVKFAAKYFQLVADFEQVDLSGDRSGQDSPVAIVFVEE